MIELYARNLLKVCGLSSALLICETAEGQILPISPHQSWQDLQELSEHLSGLYLDVHTHTLTLTQRTTQPWFRVPPSGTRQEKRCSYIVHFSLSPFSFVFFKASQKSFFLYKKNLKVSKNGPPKICLNVVSYCFHRFVAVLFLFFPEMENQKSLHRS